MSSMKEQVLQSVQENFPNIEINLQQLEHPTRQLMQCFGSVLLESIDEKVIATLNTEDILGENMAILNEFDFEVQLCAKLGTIFNEFGFGKNLTLLDMYNPVPKRTHALMGLGTYIVLYIDGIMEHTRKIASEIQQKANSSKEMVNEKQEIIEESNKVAKEIAIKRNENEHFEKESELIQKQHEAILEEMAINEKVAAKEDAEIETLRLKLANLQYEVNDMERGNKNLQEQVVTEEEFADLKHIENTLKKEMDSLLSNDCDMEDGVDEYRDTLDYINQLRKEISQINFVCLNENVEKIISLKEQYKNEENQLKVANDRKEKLVMQKMNSKSNLERLRKDKIKTFTLLEDIKTKGTTNFKNYVKSLKQEEKNIKLKKEEMETLRRNSKSILLEKRKIEKEKKECTDLFLSLYSDVLNSESAVVNKLNKVLQDLNSELDQYIQE